MYCVLESSVDIVKKKKSNQKIAYDIASCQAIIADRNKESV